jgi:hypothetical protein
MNEGFRYCSHDRAEQRNREQQSDERRFIGDCLNTERPIRVSLAFLNRMIGTYCYNVNPPGMLRQLTKHLEPVKVP